jgi:hypothetical protein
MHKKTLITGSAITSVGIALVIVSALIFLSDPDSIYFYPYELSLSASSAIIGGLLALTGGLILIYGAIQPDPHKITEGKQIIGFMILVEALFFFFIGIAILFTRRADHYGYVKTIAVGYELGYALCSFCASVLIAAAGICLIKGRYLMFTVAVVILVLVSGFIPIMIWAMSPYDNSFLVNVGFSSIFLQVYYVLMAVVAIADRHRKSAV